MNLNKVMLIGRLGRDPEVRNLDNGGAVANFSLATTDSWKDKQGQRQERTEWHSIVAWGALSSFAQNYLVKGRLIFVEGRLQTRNWEKDGVKQYKTEVVAHSIQFMEPKDGEGKPPMAVDTGQPSQNTSKAPF